MNNIVEDAKRRLNCKTKESGLTTGQIRVISSELYKGLEKKNIEYVLCMCEQLLDEHEWTLGVIAYDWAYRVRRQYSKETFFIFEKWLKKYIKGWGDCDDFCTHAMGELLSQNNGLFEYILKWTSHPDFWVRRAAAVTLIYPIRKGKYHSINPFVISDRLLSDDHYLVLKGYGWMLKVLSQYEPDSVYNYLVNNKCVMPRVAYRYAIEKFNPEVKAQLMKN